MSNIWTITAAFCPTAQLARTLLEYETEKRTCYRHIVVNCHYPINYEKNQLDFKIFMDSYTRVNPNTEVMDPGSDLGSAQSQNYVLNELGDSIGPGDYFVNLDPDAACRTPNWQLAMKEVLDNDPLCALVSCNAPMIDKFKEQRHQEFTNKTVAGYKLILPDMPTPFNLSMWRAQFFREIGGIPQMYPHYGEVEGPVYQIVRANDMYNGYLLDFMEDEQGKLMHDRAFESWKDAHARTTGPSAFLGNFGEYCESNELV